MLIKRDTPGSLTATSQRGNFPPQLRGNSTHARLRDISKGRISQFVYEIPLDPGIYELHLYFAETGVEIGLRSVSWHQWTAGFDSGRCF